MNLSIAICLVNKAVRTTRVTYDPDNPRNNSDKLFKTLDPGLQKDDYVVVPTGTRHGFTVGKVAEVDMRINFDTTTQYDWIVGTVDKTTYDNLVAQEKVVLDRIADVEENRKRKELAEAMGLAEVSLTDLDLVSRDPRLPASSTPLGHPSVEEAPTPPLAPAQPF